MEKHARMKKLRESGHSYGYIAAMLFMSKNTVKSYLRRNDIKPIEDKKGAVCRYCFKPLGESVRKLYCSNICRYKWHNQNREKCTQLICVGCSKPFYALSKDRKYCSHSCYIHTRFGGEKC